MDLSLAIKEAYTYADPDVTLFETIELTHDTFPQPIRLVNSPNKLTVTQGVFWPQKFDAIVPETEGGVRGQLQLRFKFMSVVNRKLLFTASNSTNLISAYYRQYMNDNLDPQAELPVPLTIDKVEFTEVETTLNALFPDLVNIQICRRLMLVADLPGGRL